ncbi:MAG: tetratricopeptide repeat protein [Gemmatimonadaceae bacterium]
MKKWMLIAPAAMLFAGCFATQKDVQVLQGDISLMRNERLAADSARSRQLDRAIASMRVANDSLVALSTRLTRFRADMTMSMSSVQQQLLQVQELTGQSQRRIQEVRASLEDRAAATAVPDSTGAVVTPGPNALFQVAREQMMQGSNAAARQAFQDLIAKYPKADVAPDAAFYIAETYAAENNNTAADSVYAQVAKQYAGSPRAATAIYKRAVSAFNAGDSAKARDLFNELIRKYPRSDEAALARDRVKTIK